MNSCKEVKYHREYYYLSNIRDNAKLQGISNPRQYNKRQLCELLDIPFKTRKELNKIPSIVPQKEKHEIYNHKYYQTENIRVIATRKGILNSSKYNKRQLCEMTGIEYKKPNRKTFKHSLTNVKTNKIKIFKSASDISRYFTIGLIVVINKAQNGQPLVVNDVSYLIKKID